MNLLADSVPDSGEFFLFPRSRAGAPHWDPYARGLIIGISRDTSAAHLARAALEGIAFQVADLLDAMRADTGGRCRNYAWTAEPRTVRRSCNSRQTFSGFRLCGLRLRETTALGAAYLAGLAVAGSRRSPLRRSGRSIEPSNPACRRRVPPNFASVGSRRSDVRGIGFLRKRPGVGRFGNGVETAPAARFSGLMTIQARNQRRKLSIVWRAAVSASGRAALRRRHSRRRRCPEGLDDRADVGVAGVRLPRRLLSAK